MEDFRMNRILKQVPLLIGLVASPALAAPPDDHMDQHPDAAATTSGAQKPEHHCPMMDHLAKPGDAAAPAMDHAAMEAKCMKSMATAKPTKAGLHHQRRKQH
jgi:hypothetical protein